MGAVTESEMMSQHLCVSRANHNRDSNSENCAKGSKSDSCDKKQAPLAPDIQMATNNQPKGTSTVCSG